MNYQPVTEQVTAHDLKETYFADETGWGGGVILCRRLPDQDVIYHRMSVAEATYLLYFDERNGDEFIGGWIVYNSRLDGRGLAVLDRWGGSA